MKWEMTWADLHMLSVLAKIGLPIFFVFGLLSFLRYIFHFKQYFQLIIKNKTNLINELYLAYRYFKKNELIETKYDFAILYSPYSLGVIEKKFHFDENQVKYSGYPIYKLQKELYEFQRSKHSSKGKKVLFLQERFIPAHTSISYEEEFEYFKKIIDMCKKSEYEFVMRLHPRVDHDFYKQMLASENIIIDNEKSLAEQITSSDLVVGNMSTALFGALLEKKPVVILFYPNFIPLIEIFQEVGLFADNFDELEEILKMPEVWDNKIS